MELIEEILSYPFEPTIEEEEWNLESKIEELERLEQLEFLNY